MIISVGHYETYHKGFILILSNCLSSSAQVSKGFVLFGVTALWVYSAVLLLSLPTVEPGWIYDLAKYLGIQSLEV